MALFFFESQTKHVGNIEELKGSFRDIYMTFPISAKFEADLDFVVRNSAECFYYKTKFDARLLWLRKYIENRGNIKNDEIKKDFIRALETDVMEVADVLNQVLIQFLKINLQNVTFFRYNKTYNYIHVLYIYKIYIYFLKVCEL